MPTESVCLDFPLLDKHDSLKAKVVKCYPVNETGTLQDIAVLEISDTDKLPKDAQPVKIISTKDKSFFGSSVQMLGFSKGFENGRILNGKIKGLNASGLIQIDTDVLVKDDKNAKWTPEVTGKGFSGTAVWDEQEKTVFGMIARHIDANEKLAFYMIPVDTLIKAFPESGGEENINYNNRIQHRGQSGQMEDFYNKRIKDIEEKLKLLHRKLSMLEKAFIGETRPEEKFRLEIVIGEVKDDIQKFEKELELLTNKSKKLFKKKTSIIKIFAIIFGLCLIYAIFLGISQKKIEEKFESVKANPEKEPQNIPLQKLTSYIGYKHHDLVQIVKKKIQELAKEDKSEEANIYLQHFDLKVVDLRGTDLKNSNFIAINLTDADFRESHLEDAKFIGACLFSANFSVTFLEKLIFLKNQTFLKRADFTRSELKDVDFSGAELYEAKFIEAKCYNTKFIGADLRQADFTNAELDNADFTGASFGGAKNWTLEQLKKAKTLAGIKCNDDKKCEALKSKCPQLFNEDPSDNQQCKAE